jgi:S-DNA-T family DNA segregation ATPase FtsK/SpoIIIE
MDTIFEQAVVIAKAEGKCSVSLLQRRLNLGYGRAKLILDDLEARGIVGPDRGEGRPRITITQA